MPDASRTTQLYCRLSLAASGSRKKVSHLEGESGLTPARKTYPTRYKPDRACLAAFLAEAARGTEPYNLMTGTDIPVVRFLLKKSINKQRGKKHLRYTGSISSSTAHQQQQNTSSIFTRSHSTATAHNNITSVISQIDGSAIW